MRVDVRCVRTRARVCQLAPRELARPVSPARRGARALTRERAARTLVSGAHLVHQRGTHCPVLVAHTQHVTDFRQALDDEGSQVLDVHARVHALLHLEARLRVLAQQVPDLLVVNLQEGRAHQKVRVLRGVDRVEHVLERVGDDAAELGGGVHALHRVTGV